ncbi:MAG: DUF362 domain-containing protein [Phycisphaerae bacterium]|nr:DUF362 domain-containing protein [Phycisphaerae bacterium]
MSEERHADMRGTSSCHRYHCGKYRSSCPGSAGEGLTAKVKWGWSWFWHFVFRNRVAIFIASLFWLLYRSGTQPRRLAYPCQQVAAVNVGAFIAALIPVSLFLRKHKHGQRLPKAVIVRRQAIAAVILCVVGVIGIETYQYADQLIAPAATLPNVPPPAVEPAPAVVGIAHKPYPNWRPGDPVPARDPFTLAEINELVERAIRLAGGLDHILVDKNSDDTLQVVLKPNLVNNIDINVYPENGIVTDPRVVAAVVQEVKAAASRKGFASEDVEIVIAEGTAGPEPWNDAAMAARRDITMVAFQMCGYDANADGKFDYDNSVTFSDLNDCGTGNIYPATSPPDPDAPPPNCSAVWIDKAVMRRQLWVPNILLDCDVLISIPTMKNHSNGDVTGALKNRVGCAPSDIYHTVDEVVSGHGKQMKQRLHFSQHGDYSWFGEPWNIDRTNTTYAYPVETTDENSIVNYMLVDQNLVRPQDFAVVDGLVGIMNGPAPSAGGAERPNPNMQLIVASQDSVAVDTVGALMMGYDPQYVRYLRWAYNRELGTMDTSRITQMGDHVALWRYPFEDNWNDTYAPNGSQAETSPPSLFGISVVEGQSLVNDDKVTVNGFMDNKGVTRAELAVAVLGQQNLLTNGDFENGGTGWTSWRADWGVNEVCDFNNVNPTDGTKCLRLGSSEAGKETFSSFGVYQEVAVTPGKTYRLDCQWYGRRLGSANWWEVILVDGPFDMDQADNGPIVEKNYMFAYDNATYGFPGAVDTTFGWIWTHYQYAPPKDQVDWNHRLGRRKATGNTMTVILKAGSNSAGGVEACFDNVTLREVSEDYVLSAVSNPTPGVQLTADMSQLPVGQYPGELRVTVYDAAMNEDSVYRNVNLLPIPIHPWVCTNKETLHQEAFVGDPIPTDNVEIWNCGGTGGDLNYEVTADVSWIHIVPPDGTSVQDPPTTNVHMVSYDPLPPGTHTGRITIEGSDNSETIDVTVVIATVKPDLDMDGDVDEADFGLFQRCYTGAVQASGACTAADFDGDMFVTHIGDLPVFKNCLSGTGVYPDRDCD